MKQRNFRFYLILLFILASFFLLIHYLNHNFVGNFGLEHLKKAWGIRSELARQSLHLLREYPIFGTGLETYGFIFSKVITQLSNGIWWIHHNDYIELLTDTGVIGFGLFMGSVSILVFLTLWRMRKNLSPWDQSIATQAIISIFCMGAMELSDFHLKVPSIALLFILQLALLFQSSFSKKDLPQFPTIRTRIFKTPTVLVCLALFVPIVVFSTNDYLASKLAQTEGVDRLINLQRAVQLQPSNDALWSLLSKEYEKKADQKANIAALHKAASLNPSFAIYWFQLGTLEYSIGYEQGVTSLEKAVYWAPFVTRYSVFLLGAYLRESEKVRPKEEQNEFLKKAQILYSRLQSLEVKPRPGDYEAWMGEYYHKKLERLIPTWTSQRI